MASLGATSYPLGVWGPISPFLFLFCAEGLSSLLKQATSSGSLKGVVSCPHGPQISHLLFADDNIIFCRATLEDCSHLEQILETYEHASGQKMNREKTSLFFSRNTSQDLQEEIKQHFGVEVIQQHETYLGLPFLVGRSKKNTFRALKERLDNKLLGWKEKMFSQARKEILIKVVTQAIPTYTMSVQWVFSNSQIPFVMWWLVRFMFFGGVIPMEKKNGLAIMG